MARLLHPVPPAEQARQKILQAAIRHFSQDGLAGARTEAIAQEANVNKALLYYYFKSKSNLYSAAIEEVSSKVMESALAALELGKTPGESLMRLMLNHFDRLLAKREFQSLMQQEMVRFHRGESASIETIANSVFVPLLKRMESAIREGIRTGELCEGDWLQMIYAGFGANVFYFLSAPMMRMALPFDPLTPSALKIRRTLALQFLGMALFRDRKHGASVASRVLASTPMPTIKRSSIRRRFS